MIGGVVPGEFGPPLVVEGGGVTFCDSLTASPPPLPSLCTESNTNSGCTTTLPLSMSRGGECERGVEPQLRGAGDRLLLVRWVKLRCLEMPPLLSLLTARRSFSGRPVAKRYFWWRIKVSIHVRMSFACVSAQAPSSACFSLLDPANQVFLSDRTFVGARSTLGANTMDKFFMSILVSSWCVAISAKKVHRNFRVSR